jgi:hypothetical protein
LDPCVPLRSIGHTHTHTQISNRTEKVVPTKKTVEFGALILVFLSAHLCFQLPTPLRYLFISRIMKMLSFLNALVGAAVLATTTTEISAQNSCQWFGNQCYGFCSDFSLCMGASADTCGHNCPRITNVSGPSNLTGSTGLTGLGGPDAVPNRIKPLSVLRTVVATEVAYAEAKEVTHAVAKEVANAEANAEAKEVANAEAKEVAHAEAKAVSNEKPANSCQWFGGECFGFCDDFSLCMGGSADTCGNNCR